MQIAYNPRATAQMWAKLPYLKGAALKKMESTRPNREPGPTPEELANDPYWRQRCDLCNNKPIWHFANRASCRAHRSHVQVLINKSIERKDKVNARWVENGFKRGEQRRYEGWEK